MKVEITKRVKEEVDVKTIRIEIPYCSIDVEEDWDDDLPLYNKRKETWVADVDIETGIIKKWKQGCSGRIFDKVRDGGTYHLLDENDNIVATIDDDYVPNDAIPPDDGFGDYIDLEIDENGKITNWYDKDEINLNKFLNNDYDDDEEY